MTAGPAARAITGKTRVVAVWGCPVGHSRSPAMHNAAIAALGLDWIYVPCEVAPERLAAAVAAIPALGIVGVNLTVPLKELAVPLMDDLDPPAATIGSINTVVNCQGRLKGYSTDGAGFLWDLDRKAIGAGDGDVFIWGAGGSAKAVAFALAERGCRVVIANRTLSRAQALAKAVGQNATWVEWEGPRYAEAMRSAKLLINTTSLGMAPALAHEMPAIPAGTMHSGQVVYDLVYVPARTRLLQEAERSGCRSYNGLGMLVCQGAISLSIWSGLPLERMPVPAMERAAADSLSDMV